MLFTDDGGLNWRYRKGVVGEPSKIRFSSSIGWITDKELEISIMTVDGGRSWQSVDIEPAPNSSSIYLTDKGLAIVLDSRGYLSTRKKPRAKWSNDTVYDRRVSELIDKDAAGSTFIGKGFDGSLVCIWLLNDSEDVLSFVSVNGGTDWQLEEN